MFSFIETSRRTCLDRQDKMRKRPRLVVAALLAIALVAGIPFSPGVAADWDWLEEQTKKLLDDIYEGTKNVITDEPAPPPEEDIPVSGGQVQDTPAANPNPPKIEQPTPQVQVADTPRFDKPWVTEIQTHLTTLGYSPGVIDGAFGNKSQTAITAFQQDRGDHLTGLPTPSVMAALRSDSDATPAVSAPVTTQAPDQLEQFAAGVDPVGLTGELGQEVELLDGERHLPRAEGHAPRPELDLEIAGLNDKNG